MSAATDIASGSDGTLGDRTSCPTSRLIRRSSSLLWGVSDVALRAFELRRERVILSGVYDAAGSDVSHVTCVYPLVAAL
jgi:hypothetical protein